MAIPSNPMFDAFHAEVALRDNDPGPGTLSARRASRRVADVPVRTVGADDRPPTPRRIVLATLGTRGDVQPFCVLGRALAARGHDVRLVTSRDYGTLIDRYGLTRTDSAVSFTDVMHDPDFAQFLHSRTAILARLPGIRRLANRMRERAGTIMIEGAAALEGADLVVDNLFTFFVGHMARERGIPTMRVTHQPLMPSHLRPASVVAERNMGPLGNRLSYELFRLFSPFLGGAFRKLRRETGLGQGLHPWTNPVTLGLGATDHLMAFSPLLSPPPGDWPHPALMTGFWPDADSPGEPLPDEITAFLAAGPPPVFIGFGSMAWGARRTIGTVMGALAMWGGRAILSARLRPAGALPANVIVTGPVSHERLFPHLAAVVHHGGAGTTGTALRHGLPNIILPVIGDQLYWGRRVAALGAAEEPVPLARIGAEELAARLDRATSDPRFAQAARAVGAALRQEPGIDAAVAAIEARLERARAA